MERRLFKEEHELFRETFRKFLQKEVVPYNDQWERDGIMTRDIWYKAGNAGFLCPWLPEEYGGSGADFLYSVVMMEEMGKIGYTGVNTFLSQNVILSPYIYDFGTEEQKKKYLPRCVTGELILAIAMTEPDAGSDVQAIRTTAVKDGDYYVINGQKTFISQAIQANLSLVAVKTDTKIRPKYKGISLFLLESDTPGYKKGKPLEKMGMHSLDTAELIFEDLQVHKSALLGEEGNGFAMMMKELQPERLLIATVGLANMHRVLSQTKEYIKTRKAFGRTIAEFQNTRFKMAEMCTIAEMCQAFVDRLTEEHLAGRDVNIETSMAKYFINDSIKKVVDECLQFYGGYGYMEEYPICKDYRDVRVLSLYGGTSEIMKEIISKAMLK